MNSVNIVILAGSIILIVAAMIIRNFLIISTTLFLIGLIGILYLIKKM